MGSEMKDHSHGYQEGDENKPRSRPPRRVAPPLEDFPCIEGIEIPTSTSVLSRPRKITGFYDLPGFETSWPQEFSIRRNVRDDRILVEIRKDFNLNGDDLDIFFADSEDTTSRCAVEVVGNFCRHTKLEQVTRAQGRAGQFRNIWLDERSCAPDLEGRGEARQHINPLTSFGAYNALRRQRYNQRGLPDAARRLIYVSDLDPACIHALAATASCHQAPVLRHAIYQHLHFQTSIAVVLPSSGFLTFTLALHLPFFLLRDTPPEGLEANANTKPQRAWIDLSFLDLDNTKSPTQRPKKAWGLYEAHISCVVTGTDDWRWISWGFVDAEIDGFLHDLSEDDLAMDQLAAVRADVPIWRPRDYWLKVLEFRVNQVMREWEYLIYKIELATFRYTELHLFTISGRCGIAAEEDAEIKAAFDWTVQTMGVLRRIDVVLSNTIEAWKAFSASDGDITYFGPALEAGISPNARRSLHNTKTHFRQLERLQKKINHLSKCCSQFKENLQLRLFVEGKETADGNETTSEFTVSVLYPVALVAAIFSMQQQAIPFDLSPRSFTIASFLMIIVVYTSRFFLRYIHSRWLLFRRAFVTWVGSFGGDKGLEVESRSKIVGDEERDALGTKVIRGIPAARLQNQAG